MKLLFSKIKKKYPVTYSKMKYKNRKYGQKHQEYLLNILNIMKIEKTLDVLKRFEKIKKDKFNFSYFTYLIFEKQKKLLIL